VVSRPTSREDSFPALWRVSLGILLSGLSLLIWSSLSTTVLGQASYPVETTHEGTSQTIFKASSPIHLPTRVEDRLAECRLAHPDDLHRFFVTYRCSGDVGGCSNGNLVIKFSFCTSSWTFNTVQLSMTIDGSPIALPPSSHPNNVLAAYVMDDSVAVDLPVSATTGLSAESKILVNFGTFSYQLSGGNLNTLRSIAERIR
jgi:hypothetical protein